MKISKWFVLLAFLCIFLACGGPVQAAETNFNLDFIAGTQSMWGTGSISLGYEKSGTIGNTTAGIGYAFGASSGTVEGSVMGVFNVNYNPYVTLGSSTSISMNYTGYSNASIMSSLLGAYVDLDAWVAGTKYNILYQGLAFDIDKNYTATIGGTVTGSDSITAISAGKDLLGIAGASIDVDVEQNDTLVLNALTGKLVGNLRGTGTYKTFDFTMDASTETMNLTLDQAGTWDFVFNPFSLDTSFNVDFDAELLARAYIKVLEPGNHWYDWWKFHLETYNFEYEALSIDVYDDDPFALAFNEHISGPNTFSITVGSTSVPEPATMLLFSFGLMILAGIRRILQR